MVQLCTTKRATVKTLFLSACSDSQKNNIEKESMGSIFQTVEK